MSGNKRKKDDWDDGRTIAPMDGVNQMYHRERRKQKGSAEIEVSKKERRAMIRAMFAVMLPRVLTVLLSFAAVFLLIFLWLKK